MGYHITVVRVANINKSTSVREDAEKREPQYIVGGNADWCSHCGKQYEISSENQKWNCLLTQQFHCWDCTLRTLKHQSNRTYAHQYSQQHNLQQRSTGSNLTAYQQMSGSKNYGIFTQLNSMQQGERRSSYPLLTSWMELESIMLSEISQVVRDRYHMISPLTGT